MRKGKGHLHGGPCDGCSMSRRSFLTAASVGLVTSTLGLGAVAAVQAEKAPTGEPCKYADLAGFRPRPEVRILGAVLRRDPPSGWPGAGYDFEGHRRAYEGAFSEAAQRVGVGLEFVPDPLIGQEAAAAFAARVAAEKPDGVLLHLQEFLSWGFASTICEAGVPTIIFAPIGASITKQMVGPSRHKGVHVVSSLDTEPVEQAFRMIRAKRQFEETKLLIVTLRSHFGAAEGPLGMAVHYASTEKLYKHLDATPVNDEVREAARCMRKAATKIVEPSERDTLEAARFFVMSKQLMQDEGCNAITANCRIMHQQKRTPAMPCMAATIFQDHGVTYACHGRLLSAASLMFSSYLFDRPAFMGNSIVETYRNLVVAAHCTCATRLNGFEAPPEPLILRSRAETDSGVSTQVLWREGQPVTFAQFHNPSQLTLDTGTIVDNLDTEVAGGCRTSIGIAMDRMEDARDKIGKRHHILSYGNHRRLAEFFCQLYGVSVIHSPERTPRESA